MVTYTGSTEADRLESAIYYDRIKGLIERMQRTGFVVTSGEVEALQFCIDVLVIPDEPEPQTPPQPVQQTQEPTSSPKRGRQLRPIE